jgi:hypothetical protein
MPSWSFLSNLGAVLVLVATQPQITTTEIGSRLSITERPVRRIIAELEAAGYIRRTREGRANRYEVNPILPLPGPVLRNLAVGDLIDILQARSPQCGGNLRGVSPQGSGMDGWRGPAPGH